jgi:hypothetical protein
LNQNLKAWHKGKQLNFFGELSLLVRVIRFKFSFLFDFINLGILVFLLIGSRKTASIFVGEPKAIMNFHFRWSVFLSLAIAFGGFSQYLLFRTSVKNLTSVNLDVVAKEFQLEKVNTIPFNDKSPIIGSEEAPVQIVVFSSFQCPACKTIGPILESVFK